MAPTIPTMAASAISAFLKLAPAGGLVEAGPAEVPVVLGRALLVMTEDWLETAEEADEATEDTPPEGVPMAFEIEVPVVVKGVRDEAAAELEDEAAELLEGAEEIAPPASPLRQPSLQASCQRAFSIGGKELRTHSPAWIVTRSE